MKERKKERKERTERKEGRKEGRKINKIKLLKYNKKSLKVKHLKSN